MESLLVINNVPTCSCKLQ